MTDTQKATSMPWRVVGDRYPIQSPSGNRIPMYVIAVDHPNGPWEAVYCMSANLATQIVTAVNAYDAMRDSLAYIDSVAPEIRDSCKDDEHAEIIVTIKGLRDIRAALAAAEGKVE